MVLGPSDQQQQQQHPLKLVRMPVLGLYPRPAESETLRGEPSSWHLTSLLGDSAAQSGLRTLVGEHRDGAKGWPLPPHALPHSTLLAMLWKPDVFSSLGEILSHCS